MAARVAGGDGVGVTVAAEVGSSGGVGADVRRRSRRSRGRESIADAAGSSGAFSRERPEGRAVVTGSFREPMISGHGPFGRTVTVP